MKVGHDFKISYRIDKNSTTDYSEYFLAVCMLAENRQRYTLSNFWTSNIMQVYLSNVLFCAISLERQSKCNAPYTVTYLSSILRIINGTLKCRKSCKSVANIPALPYAESCTLPKKPILHWKFKAYKSLYILMHYTLTKYA